MKTLLRLLGWLIFAVFVGLGAGAGFAITIAYLLEKWMRQP